MHLIFNKRRVLIALGSLLGLLLLLWPAPTSQAQWPPFTFRLTPSQQGNQITYDLFFVKRHPGQMVDVLINIPIPEGTRYVSSQAQSSTTVSFDGREVSFFTAGLSRNTIRVASFTVEITNPEQTIFTTQPWLAWKGDLPGDFLPGEVILDISNPELVWDRPARAWLQLEATAFTHDGLVTYALYPTNIGGRMWDAVITLPLPDGAQFLMAEAPAPFEAEFDGQEVKFTAHELARREAYGPLLVHALVAAGDEATLVTHAWGTWKNEGRAVGRSLPFQGDTRTGDIVIQPNQRQWIVADSLAEVPFAAYDLTSLALSTESDDLILDLYTWGDIRLVESPLIFVVNINTDCTGGVEYQAIYRQQGETATFRAMNPETGSWNKAEEIEAANLGPRLISLQIPYDLFLSQADVEAFCIIGTAQNRDDSYRSGLPSDRIPDTNDERVTRYRSPAALAAQRPAELSGRIEAATALSSSEEGNEPPPSEGPGGAVPVSNVTPPPAGGPGGPNSAALSTIPPAGGLGGPESAVDPSDPIAGLLAVPLDDGQGSYDVHLFSLPEGQEVAHIPYARQPDFRFDGQRLLVNKQGAGQENVHEYDLAGGTLRPVSDAPGDAWPVYDPWGNRLAYGNAALARGIRTPLRDKHGNIDKDPDGEINYADTGYKPFLFVQCSLLPPAQESSDLCRDLPGQNMIIPAGQMGEIIATHPVWAASDELLFNGCNSWAGASACGIYAVPAGSIRRTSDGFIPRPLTTESQDRPTDAHVNLVAFMSHRDGNWEAYLMDLDGSNERNISNSPANDGLPTISPNGRWVAFVSDRGGQWAVWLTPAAGGEVTKLFDLPDNPWGDSQRPWVDERISWGGGDRESPALLAPVSTPNYRLRYTPTPTPAPTLPPTPTSTPTAVPPVEAAPQSTPTPAPAATPVPPASEPVRSPEFPTVTIGEFGEITALTHQPQTIQLRHTYRNPVVLAQPPTRNGDDTAIARLTAVQPDQFIIYIQEAPDRDGLHPPETVSYLVLEAGTWLLPNGTRLEVGKQAINATVGNNVGQPAWRSIEFTPPFLVSPVVFSQVQSEFDPHWVKTRQRNIAVDGFEVALEEEEAKSTTHYYEIVGWLAIEPGRGQWGDYRYETGSQQIGGSGAVAFSLNFTEAPRFVASLASYNGSDSAQLRLTSVGPQQVELLVEEDTTNDSETDHTGEIVSYFAIEDEGTLSALPILGAEQLP